MHPALNDKKVNINKNANALACIGVTCVFVIPIPYIRFSYSSLNTTG